MTVEVADGLWSVPVWIPIPSLKRLNVYALELEGGGIALVDTGWEHPESWASLVDGLATVGRTVEDVRVVVVTHAHPDHLGLAHRIREVSGSQVLMHEVEVERMHGAASATAYQEAIGRVFPTWGVGPTAMQTLAGNSSEVLARTWDVEVEPVRHGEVLPLPGWRLEAVWTPGHTAGHLCLFDRDRGLLFSGDHVLPRISPVVGAHPSEQRDPLSEFLASLDQVTALDVRTVLPGHEDIFTDLRERVEELKAHHAARLDEVVSIVATTPGITAWDVMHRLAWSRPLESCPPPTRRLALGETQAHLVHLEGRGWLERSGVLPQRWSVPSGTAGSHSTADLTQEHP